MAADSPPRILTVRAFAKINLSLHVQGVRADGFHELRTTFQSIALHDRIVVTPRRGPFEIECDDPLCPADSTNLVWRASESVWRSAGRRGSPTDVRVRIEKRIPMGAGLGGGSSDAAAALRAFAALWSVKLTSDRCHAIARELGADVPFFLEGGTALGVARGDVLYRLSPWPRAWLVLVLPGFSVSTRDAFAWFDEYPERHRRTAAASRAPSRRFRFVSRRPPGGRTVQEELRNDLEAPVGHRHPEIIRLVHALRAEGAAHAAMSGSGSAVFGLFNTLTSAEAVAAQLAGRPRRALVTRVLNRVDFRKLSRPLATRN